MNERRDISRRDFLKGFGATVGALLAAPLRSFAQPLARLAPGRQVAALVDLTRCIGCRSCMRACQGSNQLGDPDAVPALGTPQDLRFNQWTVVNAVAGHPIKQQCMHCLEPACASACPVAALYKHELGPVLYRAERCIGCRYCMVACPFDVPKYDWNSGLTPVIGKCQFCAQERLSNGRAPACVEACPTGALRFGLRDELLAEAHERIRAHPEKYIDRIYGEKEAGGTSWLYLSDVLFEDLGFKRNLPQSPLPSFTWEVVSRIPGFVTIMAVLFGLVATSLAKRQEEHS